MIDYYGESTGLGYYNGSDHLDLDSCIPLMLERDLGVTVNNYSVDSTTVKYHLNNLPEAKAENAIINLGINDSIETNLIDFCFGFSKLINTYDNTVIVIPNKIKGVENFKLSIYSFAMKVISFINNVDFIDFEYEISLSDSYHPTPGGYQVMEETILSGIVSENLCQLY